jgi:hypothetical protein
LGIFPVEYADADGDGIRILMEPAEETGQVCWVVRNSRRVDPLLEFSTPEAAHAAHQAAQPAPVTTDKKQLLPPHIAITYQPKSVYQPLRAAQPPVAQPAPPPAPAGGLVERVAKLIANFASEGLPGDSAGPTARNALREVAAWHDQQGQRGCSLLLRDEAER